MQIKKSKPQDHKIKALIYGPSGAGKTVFTGTAKKAIYASAEGGLLSIGREVDYVAIKSLKGLLDLYSYLSTEDHKYETVVIDSITEVNEIIKAEIERKHGRSMQLQDWGELSKKIRDIFRKFRDLPMHVILVAQENYLTDEDKVRKIVPSMNGKASTEIAYFMDVVAYIHVDKDGTRWIETDSNKRFLTKDRTRKIGNDTKLDFKEWVKKVAKIKTGEQKVVADHEAGKPAAPAAKPDMKHNKALQEELKKRGAENAHEALAILNTACKTEYPNIMLTEVEASKALVKLLQVPTPKKSTKK